MISLHKIWLIIAALAGIPIAALGLLLLIPAILDRSWAALLLITPTLLVIWAFACHIRLSWDPVLSATNMKHLAVFYLTAGLISLWSSTWTYNRDGHTGKLFSTKTSILVTCFFVIPLVQLGCQALRKKSPNKVIEAIGDPGSPQFHG